MTEKHPHNESKSKRGLIINGLQILFVLLFLVLIAISINSCENNHKESSINAPKEQDSECLLESEYFCFTHLGTKGNITWFDAEEKCKSIGALLPTKRAIVNNKALLSQHFKKYPATYYVWTRETKKNPYNNAHILYGWVQSVNDIANNNNWATADSDLRDYVSVVCLTSNDIVLQEDWGDWEGRMAFYEEKERLLNANKLLHEKPIEINISTKTPPSEVNDTQEFIKSHVFEPPGTYKTGDSIALKGSIISRTRDIDSELLTFGLGTYSLDKTYTLLIDFDSYSIERDEMERLDFGDEIQINCTLISPSPSQFDLFPDGRIYLNNCILEEHKPKI